jgi:drug/metabolite transporter (DMT)-like permease
MRKPGAPSAVFAALCFIWGSTWLAIKIGLEFLPPFLFAGIRFAAATASLLILTRILHARIPRDRSSWVVMLFLGVFQIGLPYGLVFWAEQYVSSGLAAVLFATMPFFVVIFAHILVEEKLTRLKALGVIASFIGLILIFWKDLSIAQGWTANAQLYGSLAVVGSAVSGALANVVGKQHAEEIDPASNVLIQALTGGIMLTSLGLITERNTALNFTLTSVLAILYLGIVGSALAFVGLYWLLTKTTATNVSLVTFITPILALVLGWLVLQEVPGPSVGLGAVLILAGVYLTVKPVNRSF